jgi:hypothetical protein
MNQVVFQKFAEAAKLTEESRLSDEQLVGALGITYAVMAYVSLRHGFGIVEEKIQRDFDRLREFARARGWSEEKILSIVEPPQ